jgi:hypothetical protein
MSAVHRWQSAPFADIPSDSRENKQRILFHDQTGFCRRLKLILNCPCGQESGVEKEKQKRYLACSRCDMEGSSTNWTGCITTGIRLPLDRSDREGVFRAAFLLALGLGCAAKTLAMHLLAMDYWPLGGTSAAGEPGLRRWASVDWTRARGGRGVIAASSVRRHARLPSPMPWCSTVHALTTLDSPSKLRKEYCQETGTHQPLSGEPPLDPFQQRCII